MNPLFRPTYTFFYCLKYCRSYSVLCANTNRHSYIRFPSIQCIPNRCLFWEKDRKGGYDTAEKVSIVDHVKNGFKEIKGECALLRQEIKDLIETDPLLVARPGETDLIWCFNEPSMLDKFTTTCDSDHNEGYSTCNLEMSSAGRALFQGNLDLRVPKDGRIKRAGYAAIRSQRIRTNPLVTRGLYKLMEWRPDGMTLVLLEDGRPLVWDATLCEHWHRAIFRELVLRLVLLQLLLRITNGANMQRSFKRESTFNWHLYNTLVLKVRGDGRSYLVNISCEGYYDITWNDIYHYVLYTRGGPYWQISKIPFSKFILGSKGRLQDKQNRMRTDRVTHFGIACGDKIPGRFNLEIEYVGLEFDPTHEEEFAYEMYKTDKYIVGV